MRTRLFFLAASVTSIAAAAVAQGCGETETTTTPSDAGADVADVVRKDSTPPAEDAEAPCDTTKDFTKDIPDAEIADGASTSGLCIGCAYDNCKESIDECQQNCECQELAGKALECYTKTGNAIGCAGQFASAKVSDETQQTGIALFSCINSSCKEECQTQQFQDAGDSGPKDAGDGG